MSNNVCSSVAICAKMSGRTAGASRGVSFPSVTATETRRTVDVGVKAFAGDVVDGGFVSGERVAGMDAAFAGEQVVHGFFDVG